LRAEDLPDNLAPMRAASEKAVPHGRRPGMGDPGAWKLEKAPESVSKAWAQLRPEFEALAQEYPQLAKTNNVNHLGTLGTGNHFVEVCLDEQGTVWFMLHSGSRGVGNAIGTMFIALAREDAMKNDVHLPDRDLAYFEEGSKYFTDYVRAVGWAQKFAALNREVMMQAVISAVRTVIAQPFQTHLEAVNCHHNYVQKEHHFGEDVYVTRKGAVSARKGQLGIIPGSMGARSFIVRGLGNPESVESCSHGAGRVMSRTKAKATYTVADHEAATRGVECRKDAGVIDETPAAYKDIDAVMAAQADLVEVVYTLKQVVCVKG
jgi:tRNA-splicing ligase RtcB